MIMNEKSNLRILIAEADPVNRKVTSLMLKRLGYEADTVSNGLEALHALKCQPFDLVLMNIMMPVMDGLTATREIRKLLCGSKQPKIIAFTAYMLPNFKEICLEAGMDDYLAKPVTIGQLAEVLSKYSADQGYCEEENMPR